MIEVGHRVAVPWGLDEFEAVVVEIYSGGEIERAVVADRRDVCDACGRGEEITIVVPMTEVQLLPVKPMGLWYRNAK